MHLKHQYEDFFSILYAKYINITYLFNRCRVIHQFEIKVVKYEEKKHDPELVNIRINDNDIQIQCL